MNGQVQVQDAGRTNWSLWAAVILVVAGVAAYYVLNTQPTWLRWLAVAAGAAAGALVFGLSESGREFKQFVLDARNELRKVFWPSRQETWMTTLLIFIFATIAGAFFWLLDLMLAWATRAITGQGA